MTHRHWEPRDAGTEDLRGVDMADVHPAPRRRRSRLARTWETFGRGTNAIIEGLGLAPLWDRLFGRRPAGPS